MTVISIKTERESDGLASGESFIATRIITESAIRERQIDTITVRCYSDIL
jgi:hypothetical protein